MREKLRLIFRIIVAIPSLLFLQTIGTLAFTFGGILPIFGLFFGIEYYIRYLGTGKKSYLENSIESFSAVLTIFGGLAVTWSWIKTGDFDFDNYGMTHIQK